MSIFEGNRHPPTMRSLFFIFLSLLFSCAPPPKDPAVKALNRFLGALARGDSRSFWQLLSPESQKRLALELGLEAEAKEEEILGRLSLRPGSRFELDPPRSARLLEGGGERRKLKASISGEPWLFELQRVEEQWRIDFFQAGPQGSKEAEERASLAK